MGHREPDRDLIGWQPATSDPGEMFTPAGESKARWAVLQSLRHRRHPRLKAYRRSMIRTGAWVVVGGIVLVVAVYAAVALIGALA